MSLRARRPAGPGLEAPLAVVHALAPVIVRDLDSEGSPDLRVILDRVRALEPVRAARAWARGDLDRSSQVRTAVAGLDRRSCVASCAAVELEETVR